MIMEMYSKTTPQGVNVSGVTNVSNRLNISGVSTLHLLVVLNS